MELRADAQRNRTAILAAAAEVFAEHGPTATTQQVATRAGVAVGTIFRHFPTKDALLAAIMKQSLQRLSELADSTDLFSFITAVVDESASTRTVVEALSQQGIDLGDALRGLTDATARLLARAQSAGDVRDAVQVDEVMALMTALSQAAQQAGWTADLQRRTLGIVFGGLAPG
ncbi:MAG TPA: helix-turn-helix domain-containing protein [Kribbella sp.]|uniref:helix-turn-helix domain-containing protein n=1 Tax=Kribbella sp. TaxID=1871183 RepID=UPI002D79A0D3|nr:helix-turn-helix domain-containing protein [Kribbella sp.]HET6294261.1 helix-turn-helix domain-containing protein [Kribbella sp.]